MREYRAAHPEKERARTRRRRYGVTAMDVEAMLAKQNNVCVICRGLNPDSVDHCHAPGRIRGMLCRACNAGLGLFRDDPERMRAAAAHLARQPERT